MRKEEEKAIEAETGNEGRNKLDTALPGRLHEALVLGPAGVGLTQRTRCWQTKGDALASGALMEDGNRVHFLVPRNCRLNDS